MINKHAFINVKFLNTIIQNSMKCLSFNVRDELVPNKNRRRSIYETGSSVLRFVILISVAVLAATSAVPRAEGQSQVLNPNFIKARDLYNQADTETQREMSSRWTQLQNEQKDLWRLAGEVDRLNAQNQPIPWINNYNARILNWQAGLVDFAAALKAKKNSPERNAYSYSNLLNQFHVETNPRYAVTYKDGTKETKCNIFAQDVTAAMGAPLPKLMANDIGDWLNTKAEGGANGWKRISVREAEEAANQGKPTIALWENPDGPHGHIAMVRPGTPNDTRGVAEAQSGGSGAVLNATHLKTAFNDQGGDKLIEYWTHQ